MASVTNDAETKPPILQQQQHKLKIEPQTATSAPIDAHSSSMPPTPKPDVQIKTEAIAAYPTNVTATISKTTSTPKASISNQQPISTPQITPVLSSSREPASPASSASRKGKGGRRAANPHLTDEERRRERVLKNRESAMKSLQKKKRYTEDLEARARALARRNTELKGKIRELLLRLNGMPTMIHQIQNANTVTNNPYHLAASLAFPTNGMQHPVLSHQQQQQQQQQRHIPSQPSQHHYQQSINPLHAQMQMHSAAQQFSQVDQWLPNLSESFPTQPQPISSFHTHANISAPMSNPNSNFAQTVSSAMRVGMTSPQSSQNEIADSFPNLGINLNLGLGSTATSPNSPSVNLQGSLLDSSFSLGPDVSEKMNQSLDIHHMACP